MDAAQYPFGKIHYLFRKADHARWQRMESKRHILRSQQGFSTVSTSRPKVCVGCRNYHGTSYGYTPATRTPLICGFHPSGWEGDSSCPDWQGKS
jgi:hypothetical protein